MTKLTDIEKELISLEREEKRAEKKYYNIICRKLSLYRKFDKIKGQNELRKE